MDSRLTLTRDQVRQFERACARNDLQMRHFVWMLSGDNLRPVKWMADGEIAPVVYRPKPDTEGRINLVTIRVGKGKDLALAQQIKQGMSLSHPSYQAEVNASLSLAELMSRAKCLISPTEINAHDFPYAHEGRGVRNFALVEVTDPDFSGVSGPTDEFVLEKFQTLRIRPATFLELISFGAQLRKIHERDWFWSKTIIALGSSRLAHRAEEKIGYFERILPKPLAKMIRKLVSKPRDSIFNLYPCLDCGAGRDYDTVRLASCENAPWPANTHLFLGVHVIESDVPASA